jgi:hypothetical protein
VVPARQREEDVRARLSRVLGASPTVRVTLIRCEDVRCRVELEAVDLEKAAPVLERLSEPGTGFAGEARQMRLEAPVAVGADAGPYRLAFTLEY